MKANKGFTLVELLAVIVILAIILAITIPGISNIISSTTKNAFQSDAKMVLKAIQYQQLKDSNFDATTVNRDTVSSILQLSNANYKSVSVSIVDNKPNITIVGQGKWDGLTACGTFQSMMVTTGGECGTPTDNVKPVITVLGSNPVTVAVGGTYTDAGATATDDVDGNLTSIISTTGTVNTSVAGTYTITYTVSDKAGNTTTANRTVNVSNPVAAVSTLTNPSNIVNDNTTDGLYYDGTNNFYYYRGTNPKNWVLFNGYLWRIVKINSDSTIKIIFEGTPNGTSTTENGRVQINSSWVAYWDQAGGSSGSNNWDRPAELKAKIQSWYSTNITTANQAKVAPIKWCIGGTQNVATLPKTTFLANDCTAKTASAESVGLIEPSEYLYASLDPVNCVDVYTFCKENNYLYKAYEWWTLNKETSNTANVWKVLLSGNIGDEFAEYSNSIRPVINLLSTTYIIGSGTIMDPFVVQ